MKKRTFLLLGFMAVIFGVGSANVSAQSGTLLTAKIDFEFTVGKVTMPAGEYAVRLLPSSGTPRMLIRSIDGDSYALAMTNSVSSRMADDAKGLMFIKQGDKYYLYQVHIPGRDAGQELPKVKKLAESELARRTVAVKPARS